MTDLLSQTVQVLGILILVILAAHTELDLVVIICNFHCPGSSGLSVGGKAGISVGVILGVAIVVLLSIILYLVIRKLRRGDGSVQPTGASTKHAYSDGSEAQELHKDDERAYAPHELSQQSHRPLEMPGQRLGGELDPSRTLHELSNTTHRS
ncbi:MAG: hypothetical protein LQ339_006958 [Xanthoria mediterranea]|nr:MAG: hypothetical protein LQ339_006958 [Xanthoria mediterranea]